MVIVVSGRAFGVKTEPNQTWESRKTKIKAGMVWAWVNNHYQFYLQTVLAEIGPLLFKKQVEGNALGDRERKGK